MTKSIHGIIIQVQVKTQCLRIKTPTLDIGCIDRKSFLRKIFDDKQNVTFDIITVKETGCKSCPP